MIDNFMSMDEITNWVMIAVGFFIIAVPLGLIVIRLGYKQARKGGNQQRPMVLYFLVVLGLCAFVWVASTVLGGIAQGIIQP